MDEKKLIKYLNYVHKLLLSDNKIHVVSVDS